MCVHLISRAFAGRALIKVDIQVNARPFNITSFRGKALIKVDRQILRPFNITSFLGRALTNVDIRQMCVHLISRVFGVEH